MSKSKWRSWYDEKHRAKICLSMILEFLRLHDKFRKDASVTSFSLLSFQTWITGKLYKRNLTDAKKQKNCN